MIRNVCLIVMAISAAAFAAEPPEHPFMLWTREDAAELRKLIDTQPWAQREYESMRASRSGDLGRTFDNLFAYLVMGDEQAGEHERKYLLSFIGTHPRNFHTAIGGGRHFDNYLAALRYDVLYDSLTPQQRSDIEQTFRAYIHHHLHEDKFTYTRTSWLPNMQWPRPLAAHIMAAAMGDRDLILQMINSNGGWKQYFDTYIADGCMYFEELGKQYSMVGEMLLFCRALERLGMDELGYGYVGAGGATMRRYLESYHLTGYPAYDLGTDRPQFPRVTMGDARGGRLSPRALFQHANVIGYLADGSGGNVRWTANNMNGRDHKNAKVDKMSAPLWFEMAHDKWPEAGFDFFLAQMRPPDNDLYYPSLYFGLSPTDPAAVKPPLAPSAIYNERGFVVLRADESGDYWTSEAPACALQLATYYVHYTHDCFSLLGLHAFNRPIYMNRHVNDGYAGSDPWTDHPRGQSGVVVDNRQVKAIGEVPVRHGFDTLVKFVSARGEGLYPAPQMTQPAQNKALDDPDKYAFAPGGVSHTSRSDQSKGDEGVLRSMQRSTGDAAAGGVVLERTLMLTREYMLDITRLSDSQEHDYHWQVQALGFHQPEQGQYWRPSDDLLGKLYDMSDEKVAQRLAGEMAARYELKDTVKLSPGSGDWSATIVQGYRGPAESAAPLGQRWYAAPVGVRVWMLGGGATTAYAGLMPAPLTRQMVDKKRVLLPPNYDYGGTTLIAARRAAATTFVAVHEPFKHKPTLETVRAIQQSDEGVAVAVTGGGDSLVNDRLLYAHWLSHDRPITLAGDGESFTFVGNAFVRIGQKAVEASGDIRAMKVRVRGRPSLTIDGKTAPTTISGGWLVYQAD